MPPSPALKCSPARELRGGDNHKRGRSFESGLLFKEKDEDLALFNEMQTKEKESFLLQSSDDFEDTFSTKLKHFSDFKLGISIPVRGESSELLNADGEKNDYDWLLTPPDTPLFPSLDDEPTPVNVARRGRPRSQPISISRSSTMEKSYRSSRGSASPNRLSPSPRSGNNSFQSTRGRPSSAPHSSPNPALRATTPTRRSSPPPSKPSTPVPRSSTPTPRRMSAGSKGTANSSSMRGTSPIRTSRGNSASPKIRAWQSNIPGFSLEAPPNLRTSLADRPASYIRGSSPASRNGRDSTSKYGRQSMSPTTSRSVSSSHSHDRDRFSSHSKASVASSGDDDLDSVQSIPMSGSDFSVSKRVGAFPNNRQGFSKKSPKVLSSSSAPKRSFDSALRQMDHRKTPQNMFRPLLSSVPSTTFYAGKGNTAHRNIISRNSSVTTSSNASSDQGTIVAPDTEGSDRHHDDTTSDFGKVLYPDVQEEIFAFDKVDALDLDVKDERHDRSPNLQLDGLNRDSAIECDPAVPEEEFSHHGIDMEVDPTSDALSIQGDCSEGGNFGNMRVCSKCSLSYRVTESVEGDTDLCPDCRKKNELVNLTNTETTMVVAEDSALLSMNISVENKPLEESESLMVVPKSVAQVFEMVEPRVSEHEEKAEQSHKYSRENSLTRSFVDGGEQRFNYPQGTDKTTVGYYVLDKDNRSQQLQHVNNHLDTKVETSEGAGISLLLKRSSSSKGPVVQGRTFTATSIPYEDLSYTRDSSNSFRSSIGHGSASASSSVDFSSSRQTETRVQRQLSSRKSDMENYRYDISTKSQSVASSLSGSSNQTIQALGLARSTNENFGVSAIDMKNDDVEGSHIPSQSKLLASENIGGIIDASFTGAAVFEHFGHNESSRTLDASTSEFSSHTTSVLSEQNSISSFPSHEDRIPCENGEDTPKNARSVLDVETSVISPGSSYEEEHSMVHACPDSVDVVEVPAHSSLATITEIEIENNSQSLPGSEIDDASPEARSIMNEIQDSDKDTAAISEPSASDQGHDFLEESTVLLECRRGSKGRSLTLEEATDAILFCSSIVHDLAYQAATIAIEKKNEEPLEDSRPTVTILGKSSGDRKDPRGRTVSKGTAKSLKPRQRRVGTNAKAPSSKENDENTDESTIHNVGVPNKVDNTKPPKLESKCNCTIM